MDKCNGCRELEDRLKELLKGLQDQVTQYSIQAHRLDDRLLKAETKNRELEHELFIAKQELGLLEENADDVEKDLQENDKTDKGQFSRLQDHEARLQKIEAHLVL